MVIFIWTIKLDRKNRLVLPLSVRKSLGISNSVSLKLVEDKVVITRADGLKNIKGVKISKNCLETARIV